MFMECKSSILAFSVLYFYKLHEQQQQQKYNTEIPLKILSVCFLSKFCWKICEY